MNVSIIIFLEGLLLGLPCVLFLEDMSFLVKNNLSSEDVKKCSNVLLFGILNSENMSNHAFRYMYINVSSSYISFRYINVSSYQQVLEIFFFKNPQVLEVLAPTWEDLFLFRGMRCWLN